MPKNPPEDPLDLIETRNTALIKGGLRSVIAAAPVVGGALAQAWSEYQAYKQSERVQQFFERLTQRLSAIEHQVTGMAQQIAKLPDAAELLEEVVEGVKRETQQEKRDWYVNALTYFIREPTDTTRDDRRSILEDIDVLTAQDLTYLLKFEDGALRGDWLTGSYDSGWSDVGAPSTAEDEKWDMILGPAVNSLAKLESRGLIVQTAINAMFGSSGDGGAWYNRFRRKAWRLTPIGVKLLNAARCPTI
jgi:hypothetical protein